MRICIYPRLDRRAAKPGFDFPYKIFFLKNSKLKMAVWKGTMGEEESPVTPTSFKQRSQSVLLPLQPRPSEQSTPCLSLSQRTCVAHVTLESNRKIKSLPHWCFQEFSFTFYAPYPHRHYSEGRRKKKLWCFICEAAEAPWPSRASSRAGHQPLRGPFWCCRGREAAEPRPQPGKQMVSRG